MLVAHDMRSSGVESLPRSPTVSRSQGADVVLLGLASTDLLYTRPARSMRPADVHGIAQPRAVQRDQALLRGRPSDWRRVRPRRYPKPRRDYLAAGDIPTAGRLGEETSRDLLDAFATHVVSFIDPAQLRPLRVIADTANGMGGLVVPAVLERLPGIELEVMYGKLDGTFPNHPADPLQPANQRDLQRRVVSKGADVGLAFDGDADRVFLVDELGRGMSGSTTTAMLAVGMLRKHPGSKILHN